MNEQTNSNNTNKRYQVINMDINFAEMETNSFSRAIGYAVENDFVVFDKKENKIVYDGYLDEFCG